MYVSQQLGFSSAAIEIINGRWNVDKFGIRNDEATEKLFNTLPNTSSFNN